MTRCGVEHKDLLTGIDVDRRRSWRFELLGQVSPEHLDPQPRVKLAYVPNLYSLPVDWLKVPLNGRSPTRVMQHRDSVLLGLDTLSVKIRIFLSMILVGVELDLGCSASLHDRASQGYYGQEPRSPIKGISRTRAMGHFQLLEPFGFQKPLSFHLLAELGAETRGLAMSSDEGSWTTSLNVDHVGAGLAELFAGQGRDN
jgi:hypothetical protein